jgi:hypothetical protein
MSEKKPVEHLWSGHPSVYVFIGEYCVSFLVLLALLKLEHMLFPEVSYFQLSFFFWEFFFRMIFSSMPSLGPALLGLLLLQIIFWGIVGYNLFLVMQTRFTTYYLTGEEMIVRYLGWTGIYTDHTELYRLVDFTLLQPIVGMIFKFSNLRMRSTDHSHPYLCLSGISEGQKVLRLIREQTEKCRMQKGVREFTSGQPC